MTADHPPLIGDHAIVLGASMAGLLTARVLSESFARVTVVERDELPPEGVTYRRGVPQSHHPHALLPVGRQILDHLFPGMSEHLVADGALTCDPLAQMRILLGGHRFQQAPSGSISLLLSRPFLEAHVRAAVRRIPTVTVLERCDALRPVLDAGRVTGVELWHREAAPYDELLQADLVVDTTGRASRMPTWLRDLDRTAPPEERVTVNVGYTSGRFRLRPEALGTDAAVLTSATPTTPRGGAAFAVENGEHEIGLFGSFGDLPPDDLDGFRQFAAALAFPDIGDALDDATPVVPLRSTRFPANVRRRYDRLTDMPGGLFVLGDALCAFNPIYGQGMSVAALQARVLHQLLRRGHIPDSETYFRSTLKAAAPAWQMATGSDLQDPRVEGRRTGPMRLLNAYIARVHAAASSDPTIGKLFLDVAGLTVAPPALLRPATATRVLRANRRRQQPLSRHSHSTTTGPVPQ